MMVRGLLAGLCSGGAVAVVGLSALSVLVPLPQGAEPQSGGQIGVTGGTAGAASVAPRGVSRSVPGPLAVPDPSPEADATTASARPVSADDPAPAPERVEVPRLPELAAPDVPQSDPLAAEPAVTRASPLWLPPAEPSGKPVPNLSVLPAGDHAPEVSDLPLASGMGQDGGTPAGTDGAPLSPKMDDAETTLATPSFASPPRPVSVDAATGVAATDTSTASRPDPLALPVIPASGAMTAGDALRVMPAAEGIIPVPPPGDAYAPALAPVAGDGTGAVRVQTPIVQDIVVVPRKPIEFGPLRQPTGTPVVRTN